MNTIHVQFQGDFGQLPDVSVPVEVIDSEMNFVSETTASLAGTTEVPVSKPGLYQVRASLPSGERVVTNVTMPDSSDSFSGPSVTATLSPKVVSPQETEAWAYTLHGALTSYVRHAGTAVHTLVDPALESAVVSPVKPGAIYWNHGMDSPGIFHLWRNASSDIGIETNLTPMEDTRILCRLAIKRSALDPNQSASWDICYQSFDLNSGSPVKRLLIAVPPLPDTELYLVENNSGIDSAAYPVRPILKGSDAKIDALLSYLAQGAFEEARAIGGLSDNDMVEILYQKKQNPSAAVVSVYYMMRAGTLSHPDWVKNLADWFPLIPDGPVLYAWCLLKQEKPDYVGARSYLLMATQRGIPIYTYGIRLLYDGLNLFAERDPTDDAVRQGFLAARRLAAAVDWHSAVTSLALATDATGNPQPVLLED